MSSSADQCSTLSLMSHMRARVMETATMATSAPVMNCLYLNPHTMPMRNAMNRLHQGAKSSQRRVSSYTR